MSKGTERRTKNMKEQDKINLLKEFLLKDIENMKVCEESFAEHKEYDQAERYNAQRQYAHMIYDMLCDNEHFNNLLVAVGIKKNAD